MGKYQPYSEATRRLVADVLMSRHPVAWTYAMQDAAPLLDALAAAGLLLPEGAETRTEHEIEWRRVGQTRGGVQELTYWDLDEAALATEVEAAARLGREPVSHRWREVRTWGSPAYLTDGPRYVGPWVDAVRLAVGDSKPSVQDPSVSVEETPQ